MQILTTEDARYIDQEVPKQLGVSLEILMENAGRGIVDALWGQYDVLSIVLYYLSVAQVIMGQMAL